MRPPFPWLLSGANYLAVLEICADISEMKRKVERQRRGKGADRVMPEEQWSGVEINSPSLHHRESASLGCLRGETRKADKSCATGKTGGVERLATFRAGSGSARDPVGMKKPAFRQRFAGGGGCCGQTSSAIISVKAGCGSSMSSAEQVAMSFTSFARWLSFRTYRATGRRSVWPWLRRMAKRAIQTRSHNLPASSWPVTPSGTAT